MAVNSIAAQEFGSDYTDLFRVEGAGLRAQSRPVSGWIASLEGAIERHRALSVNASPANGEYQSTLAAWPLRARRATLALERPTSLGPLGVELQLRGEASVIGARRYIGETYDAIYRYSLSGAVERPLGGQRFVARSLFAWADGPAFVPAQYLVHLGGPVTGPGYDFHQFASKAGASQRVELQTPFPFFSIPLGRYGKTPAALTLAPFFHAIWIDEPVFVRGQRSSPIQLQRNGWHPAFGIGILSIFDLLRIDVAKGTRDGRWTFSADVSRDFWRIL